MSIRPVPTDNRITDGSGNLTPTWQAKFSSDGYWLAPIGASGTSTNRPVNTSQVPLYVGQTYFDTTLGKPIWVKSLNSTVWVDATGSPV